MSCEVVPILDPRAVFTVTSGSALQLDAPEPSDAEVEETRAAIDNVLAVPSTKLSARRLARRFPDGVPAATPSKPRQRKQFARTPTMTESCKVLLGSEFLARTVDAIAMEHGSAKTGKHTEDVMADPLARGVMNCVSNFVGTMAAPHAMNFARGFSTKPTPAAEADVVEVLERVASAHDASVRENGSAALEELYARMEGEEPGTLFAQVAPLAAFARSGALRAVAVSGVDDDDCVNVAAAVSPLDNFSAHATAARVVSAFTAATDESNGEPVPIIDPECAATARQGALRIAHFTSVSDDIVVAPMTDKQREKEQSSAERRAQVKKNARDKRAKLLAERAARRKEAIRATSRPKSSSRKKKKERVYKVDELPPIVAAAAGIAAAKSAAPPNTAKTMSVAESVSMPQGGAQVHSVAEQVTASFRGGTLLATPTLVAVLRLLRRARVSRDPRIIRLLGAQSADPFVQATGDGGKPVPNHFSVPNCLARMVAASEMAGQTTGDGMRAGAVATLTDFEVVRAQEALQRFNSGEGSASSICKSGADDSEAFVAAVIFSVLALAPEVAKVRSTEPVPLANGATLCDNELPAGFGFRAGGTTVKFVKRLFVRMCKERLDVVPKSVAKADGAAEFWTKFGSAELTGNDTLLWTWLHAGCDDEDKFLMLATVLVPIASALFPVEIEEF